MEVMLKRRKNHPNFLLMCVAVLTSPKLVITATLNKKKGGCMDTLKSPNSYQRNVTKNVTNASLKPVSTAAWTT